MTALPIPLDGGAQEEVLDRRVKRALLQTHVGELGVVPADPRNLDRVHDDGYQGLPLVADNARVAVPEEAGAEVLRQRAHDPLDGELPGLGVTILVEPDVERDRPTKRKLDGKAAPRATVIPQRTEG
eukprot:1823957-Pyramimonas_sp.AAC.1